MFRPWLLLFVAVTLFFPSPMSGQNGTADEFQLLLKESAKSVDQLQELLETIKQQVPDGWQVEFDFSPGHGIVIRSDDPLAVRYHYPSGPAQITEEPPEQEQVEIRLTLMPYMPPATWKRKSTENARRKQWRSHFAEHVLNAVPHASKSGWPQPPRAFRPRSDDEQRRLHEYTFLWMRTVPEKLPTHHYRELSFSLVKNYYLEIVDAQKVKQYKDLLGDLEQMLTAYAVAE